jgi:hypothetical protein
MAGASVVERSDTVLLNKENSPPLIDEEKVDEKQPYQIS